MSDSVFAHRQIITGRLLYHRAATVYDSTDGVLASAAQSAWRNGFQSGAEWMRLALTTLRETSLGTESVPSMRFQILGLLKYGIACSAALAWIAVIWRANLPILGILAIPIFYAVEAQTVFLFPLVLDGHARPFRTAREWTIRAGGTWRVMLIVMPIAVRMLVGGFLGRGFVRSWCLGCLAVCVWYELLRLENTD